MLRYLFAMLAVLLTVLSGCTAEDAPSLSGNTMEDLYHFSIKSRNLYKFNLQSGESTPACPDPLCDLGEDCMFTDVSYVRAVGNTIYFSRSGTDAVTDWEGNAYVKESVCSYNYETGRLTVLCEFRSDHTSSMQGKLDYHNGWIYFYRQTPDPQVTEYSLYRVPAKGGKIEDMNLSVTMWHGAMYNDRLYFWDNVNTLYSTDLYGNDRIDEIILTEKPGRIACGIDTDDGYLYFWIIYGDNSCEIGKLDLNKHRMKILWETEEGTAASLYRIGDTLYFLLAGEDIPYGKTKDGRTLYDCYGGKIYALSVNGGKPKTVYDDPNTHLQYLRACGNEIMVFCEDVVDGERYYEQFVLGK